MGLLATLTGRLHRWASGKPPTDDFWYEDVPGLSQAGMKVTPDIALKASAVFACVKVLAETVATLSLNMYRRIDGGREPAPDHPLEDVLGLAPNRTQTAVEFWQTMVLHAVLRGNAYAEIVPGPRGAVDQLVFMHPDHTRTEVLKDRSLRFQYADPLTGERRTLVQEEVFRIPGLSSDGINGLRVVDLAADAIGLSMAADTYAARVFAQGVNVSGFLIHPKKLSPEAQKNLVDELMRRIAGARNAHRPIVLQEGLKFEKASMTAREAQLETARKWQIGEVARFFRMPLHMLGIDDQTNRSTVEEQAIDFIKYTLRPLCKRIEQAISRDLITARQYVAKFNLEDLLRGNAQSRSEYFAKALGSGGHPPWMTPNEVRKIEGLNPLPGGDAFVQPANLQRREGAKPLAMEDNSLKARAERMVRKEITAIRKAAMRHAGDSAAFRQWVTAFYGGHVSDVMALGVEKEMARSYCERQRDKVLQSDDVAALLSSLETSMAAEIAARFEAAT